MTAFGVAIVVAASIATSACSPPSVSDTATAAAVPTPSEVIDLGALVTEDLARRVWGT